MIEAVGLVKSFGDTYALRGIDLAIPRGQLVAVIGPNGAGKTTFLRILAGLNRPSEGRVRVAGHDVAQAPEAARRAVGFLSHQPLLYEDLSAEENLNFYGTMYGVPSTAAGIGVRDRAHELIDRVGLWPRRGSLVRTYSRGMKQRLAIARALLHDPPVLLLDEPYTGLDQQATEMLNGIFDEMEVGSRTVVLTTHNLEQGLAWCDRAVLLRDGRIAYETGGEGANKAEFRELYKRRLVMPHEAR